MAKKATQGSQSKVETLTIRVSPKLKFGLELLARKQHRNLSSVAEWALNNAIYNSPEGLIVEPQKLNESPSNILDDVWDPYEADRFVNLALKYPQLLSYEEEVTWKLIKENGSLWKGHYDEENEWTWTTREKYLIIERLREHFDTFKKVANGEQSTNTLPEWQKNDTTEETKDANTWQTEDDIPF